MRKRRILNNRGDTIVEVMLALVVISTAIGVSYSVANRSLKGMRISQERAEATKIAESQAERLKKLKQDGTPINYNNFCIYKSLTSEHDQIDISTNPLLAQCAFSNAFDSGDVNNRYHVFVNKASSVKYEVAVWWAGLNNNTEIVKLNYLIP